MKQKTIILFWGAQNGGKSSTIQLVKEELIVKFINPAHTYLFPLPKVEITATLHCKGFTVGIESSGDDLYYCGLNRKLDDFITVANVDLLVCACRVTNNVHRHIVNLATANGYRILKVTNYRGDTPSFNQHDLNLLSAKNVVELIDQIFTGSI